MKVKNSSLSTKVGAAAIVLETILMAVGCAGRGNLTYGPNGKYALSDTASVHQAGDWNVVYLTGKDGKKHAFYRPRPGAQFTYTPFEGLAALDENGEVASSTNLVSLTAEGRDDVEWCYGTAQSRSL